MHFLFLFMEEYYYIISEMFRILPLKAAMENYTIS